MESLRKDFREFGVEIEVGGIKPPSAGARRSKGEAVDVGVDDVTRVGAANALTLSVLEDFDCSLKNKQTNYNLFFKKIVILSQLAFPWKLLLLLP